jgi:lipoate---protein ligase
MRYLDLILATPAENLALDEALLDEAEAGDEVGEILRIWEPRAPLVVVGRSSHAEIEVRLDECRRQGIPVLRRASGGAAIVTGPGCLMYALVLSYRRRPALRTVSEAHQFVLGRVAAALGALVPGVHCRGTSDLAIGEHKFSGNSLRAKRGHLLYHGTLLYDFPLRLVADCLAMPPRQPCYRQGRDHADFVANLPIAPGEIRRALIEAWDAREPCIEWPAARTRQLVDERYVQPDWNLSWSAEKA